MSWLYPHTFDCTLSTGEVIPYPFVVSDGAELGVLGTVELDAGAEYPLPSSGYEPVTVKVPGSEHPLGLAVIQAVQYKRDTLMPYNEFIFGFPVRRKSAGLEAGLLGLPELFSRLLKDPFWSGNLGLDYMAALYLNEELPTKAGAELGGWNKELADVRYSFESERKSVSVSNADGGMIFHASTELEAGVPLALPALMDIGETTATTRVKSVFAGKLRAALVSANDTVELGDGSSWSRLLKKMHFNPIVWQYSPSFEMAVVAAPGDVMPPICKPVGN